MQMIPIPFINLTTMNIQHSSMVLAFTSSLGSLEIRGAIFPRNWFSLQISLIVMRIYIWHIFMFWMNVTRGMRFWFTDRSNNNILNFWLVTNNYLNNTFINRFLFTLNSIRNKYNISWLSKAEWRQRGRNNIISKTFSWCMQRGGNRNSISLYILPKSTSGKTYFSQQSRTNTCSVFFKSRRNKNIGRQ